MPPCWGWNQCSGAGFELPAGYGPTRFLRHAYRECVIGNVLAFKYERSVCRRKDVWGGAWRWKWTSELDRTRITQIGRDYADYVWFCPVNSHGFVRIIVFTEVEVVLLF